MSTLEMHNSYDDAGQVSEEDSLIHMANSWPDRRVNSSGLSPRGHAVLVKPYEPEAKGSLIAIPDSVRTSMQMLEQRAEVIELGPCAWADEGEPRALPGEKVMIAKYAGVGAIGPLDGVQYRIVNDRDIFCVLEEPK